MDVISCVVHIGDCISGSQVGIIYSMIVYIVVSKIGILDIVGDIVVIVVVNGLVVVCFVVSAIVVVVSIVVSIAGGFVVGLYSVVDAVIRLVSEVCYEVGVVCLAGSF